MSFDFPILKPHKVDKIVEALQAILLRTNKFEDVLEKLHFLDSEQKVLKLEVLLKQHNLLKDVTMFSAKNDKKSAEFRKEGNTFFVYQKRDLYANVIIDVKTRNLGKAMELYNESLCWAQKDSENLAYAYANRSAVFYEWHEWEKCLENIELARNCKNFPECLLEKLNKREKNCKEIIEREEKDENLTYESSLLKLKYPPHPKIPYVADCVKLAETKKYGRHVLATRDINIGDVIAHEPPFILSLNRRFANSKCLFCLSDNSYSLLPCHNCTRAMFCNEKCREDAMSSFHKFECSIIDAIYDFFPDEILMSIRLISKIFSDKNELNKIKMFIETQDDLQMNAFNINHNISSYSEQYKAVHSLLTHDIDQCYQNFSFSCSTAIMISFLKENEHAKEIFKDPVMRKFFYGLMYHSFLLTLANPIIHRICWSKPLISLILNITNFSCGIYPFMALINHSCLSNVTPIYCSKLKCVILYASAKIKKGEQLYLNYT